MLFEINRKMNDRETELYRCFESRQNIIKLLKYRNYDFEDSKQDLDFEKFKEIYSDFEIVDIKDSMSSDISIINNENEEKNCIVQWISESKLNADKINEVVSEIPGKTKTVILISDNNPTPNAIESVKLLKSVNNIKIDIWNFNQTQFFAPDHIYVPSHRICTQQEKNKIFNVYGRDLPKINTDDIMVKYLAAVKGNLIEIIRPSETMNNKLDCSYRIVT